MMFEIESSILEIEYEMKVKADIAKAYADLKSAHAANKFNATVYEANKCEMDDVCDQLRRGWMKVSNEYDVESIYSVINSMYMTINYVERDSNPLAHCCIPDSWVKCETRAPLEYVFKQSDVPYESDKILHIATPDPRDCKDVPRDDDDDGFNVIVGNNRASQYKTKTQKKVAVAEIIRSYEVTHANDVPKEVFFHNMSMAIQRFCANYSCTFDGYTIKYAYCNINFTHMTKDIGSKKLRYTQQQGVLLVDYRYTSNDLKNNTKEVNDAVETALFEFHKCLYLYAECDYLCPY